MEQSDLYSLEARIDALVQLCKQLAEENQALRETEANLMSERATLLEKNALARTRLETMITRLKSMEVGT
jgi:cell division protein ZapB